MHNQNHQPISADINLMTSIMLKADQATNDHPHTELFVLGFPAIFVAFSRAATVMLDRYQQPIESNMGSFLSEYSKVALEQIAAYLYATTDDPSATSESIFEQAAALSLQASLAGALKHMAQAGADLVDLPPEMVKVMEVVREKIDNHFSNKGA